MKSAKILTILVVALGLIFCQAKPSEAAPMGTAFTYQGHLYDNNDVADGLYDLQFKLFDANNDGNQIGGDVNKPDEDVIDGYFTVELDFGGVFDGNAVWLEIGIRPGDQNDPNVYPPLSPRQEVTPTPYAIYAGTSGTAHSLDAPGGPSDAVYVADNGYVGIGTTNPQYKLDVNGDTRINGFFKVGENSFWWDTVTLHRAGAPDDYMIIIDSDDASSTRFFSVSHDEDNVDIPGSGPELFRVQENGNVGINTTDPTEKLDVDGKARIRVLGSFGPNTVKVVMADPTGVLQIKDESEIGGADDDWAAVGAGVPTLIGDIYHTGDVGIGTASPAYKLHVEGKAISGASSNASGQYATVSGGTSNTASGYAATVCGGFDNDATNFYATVAGGRYNAAGGYYSFAGGYRAKVRDAAASGDGDGDEGTFVWADSTYADFQSTDPDQFLIRASGGVGIGTTSPSEQLDVDGGARIRELPEDPCLVRVVVADGTGVLHVRDANTLGGADYDWEISGNDMSSIPSGNVGIGTTIAPSEKLEVIGNININSVYKIGGDTVLSVDGTRNIFVGVGAGNTGVENTFVGEDAGNSNTTGNKNTFLGFDAGNSNIDGSQNTFLGLEAGNFNTTGYLNTAVGNQALRWNTTGYRNSAMGYDALFLNSTGMYNSAVGALAGYNSTGSGNVFIGYQAGFFETGDNKLYIANSDTNTTPLIYGDFSSGNVGIGTTSPSETLDVDGGARIRELPEDVNLVRVVVADGIGVLHIRDANTLGGADNDWSGAGSTQMFTTNLADKVGIGTATPAAKLTVNGAILREGSWMRGLNPSPDTHINLGVSSTTGRIGNYSWYCTVGGGEDNNSIGSHTTVGGGEDNTASGGHATVGGGNSNTANAFGATVGGGWTNTASASSATVGGGQSNTASGNFATVGGGLDNTASGQYSFAAGRRAKADHQGTFVWGDSTSADFASTDNNQFLIRASGGVGIRVNDPTEDLDVLGTAKLRGIDVGGVNTVNVVVDLDGKLWKTASSKRYKTNINDLEISTDAVLELRPVSFQYKSSGHRDIGLIAEEVEEHLQDLVIYDKQGRPDAVRYDKVGLYLLTVVKELKAENESLKQRVEAMEEMMHQQPLTLMKESRQ